MNKKLIAIMIVAILVVAAVGAVVYTSSNQDKDKRMNTDEIAAVYGNANNDYTVDNLDTDFIQDIVNGKTSWDKSANPFADANNDGAITQEDVELTQKIISREPCEVYYYNYFGEAQKLKYPVDASRIAVTYWQQAEEVGILGLWDNVVCANAIVADEAYLYDTSNVTYMGDESGASLDSEQVQLMLEKKVTLIVGSGYDSVRKYADPLAEQGVQTIYLWHAGNYCLGTLLTMGVLVDAEEQAQKFVQYWVDLQEMLEDRVPAKEDRPSAVIVMNHKDEDYFIKSYGGIFTSVNDPAGEWQLIGKLANVFTTDVTGSKTLGRNYYGIDWFIQNPFDYMVVMGAGTGANTQAEYDSWFETITEKYYSHTEEYKNGNILGTTYSFGGFSAYSLLPILAWMLYPDDFTYDEALKMRQYYYDEFVPAKIDCTSLPRYYLGSGYDASYL